VEVETIDEDLGRSGSGLMERPGFQRLVTEVCEGRVGAVFCVEASRLARNGRDWHHLIELCGLVGAVVVDPEGIYDPRIINDRLVLGLRGTMSEFELSIMRDRMFKASRQKAQRGELRFCLPVGFYWGVKHIELDADVRVQNAVRLVLQKFQELGSARQVLFWFREQQITLPTIGYGEGTRHVCWKLPVYNSVLAILTNPLYAGAYAFGRTEARTQVVGGRARQTAGHPKPREQWTVLIRDHHPGYISWERFELNQEMLAENAHMKSRMGRQRGRGGPSLLVGLLRCRRCGRMLHVQYNNRKELKQIRYVCVNGNINQGLPKCIGFGGVRVDQAVSKEILKVIQPLAIDAALQAADQLAEQQSARVHALELELEQARYEARLAARRYEAIDPDNRLVASELESRWNAALCRVREVEEKIEQARAETSSTPVVNRDDLLALAEDLPGVWESPASDPSLKQRIIRILIQEIVADVNEQEVILVIHWVGGRHSELRVPRLQSGHHTRCTQVEAVDIVRQMAGSYKDEEIALTLNRLRLKTGVGNSWNERRVRSLRSHLNLPACDPRRQNSRLNLKQVAEQMAVSTTIVRRLIASKVLPATQVVPGAPWEIAATVIALPEVIQAATALRNRESRQRRPADERTPSLPGFHDE
ncbi:MAG TPA: recombinase family protein, partial [Terriglobales bacterium]|nr:recombinase family protein [Terriglobales bacterium]